MSFVRRHVSAIISTVVVVALAVTLVVLTLGTHGYTSRHLDLHDGGVWVTNDQRALFGRLNKPAGALDLGFSTPGQTTTSGRQLDVRQDGAAVVAWDQTAGSLMPVDVDHGTIIEDQDVSVPGSAVVAMNGGTLAVLDTRTFAIRALRFDPGTGITSMSALSSARPALASFHTIAISTGGTAGADLSVGVDGVIHAATTDGQELQIKPSGDGFGKPERGQLSSDTSLRSVQVTSVGPQMVIFDPTTGTVLLPGDHTSQVTGSSVDAQVQAASATQSAVVIATTTDLWQVPLDGSAPTKLGTDGSGKPAEPTWLGSCVHSAWAGNPGVYERSCNLQPATHPVLPNQAVLQQPIFRLNRDSILLNDLADGNVYDLDTPIHQVADWSSVQAPPTKRTTKKNKNSQAQSQSQVDLPPKARPVVQGARAGRTVTVHVLDSASDPNGDILSVRSVGKPDAPGVGIVISPDGQTIEAAMPASARTTHFEYTIDDGRGKSSSSTVTINPVPLSQNTAPTLRPHFSQPSFTVASGGNLSIPVLGDWRDAEGDPVVLQSATATAGTVTTDQNGSVDYFGPASGGKAKITYTVADGQGATTRETIPVAILGPTSDQFVKPIAQPDTARGQVGRPIVIDPLANDLPGADPSDPNATLSLLSTVASPAGTTVTTDTQQGTVTVVATHAGTYLINYVASYGHAGTSRATIRIDVSAAPSSPLSPVAMPDTAVAYGQNPVTVDVLANDFDPAGNVLTVQSADALSSGAPLQVAVVRGRWVRINASSSISTPSTQVIDYTVSNGVAPPATGQITVTFLPPPSTDSPIAVTDYATVRTGDSVLVPVLDNDIDPTGAPLSLKPDGTADGRSGQLAVSGASGQGPVGSAYVSGAAVRYVAPSGVTAQRQVQATYVVANPSGASAQGTVVITIMPLPTRTDPNQPPNPTALTARVVAGDTVTVTVPTTGIDPDGDTATVTGIASATRLGRVLAITPTSITYQAFPTAAGTDSVVYTVADRFGGTGQAAITIGVVPPAQTQPPVAVDDSVTAAPSTKIQVDVLANDVVAAGDTVTIESLDQTNPDLGSGARLLSPSGPVELTTGTDTTRPQTLVYRITDGLATSVATLTIHVRKGYQAPPVALDAFAKPRPNATSVTVNVLQRDSDPSGSPLRVAQVFGNVGATIDGANVTLPVRNYVQNVPYEIVNGHGATAAAVIHVPAGGTGLPYGTGEQVVIGKNASKTINIGDYVLDPTGRRVRLTTTDTISAAPATALTISSPSSTSLKLTGRGGYVGPASITFQVTDGSSLNDPKGQLAFITLPVQVGPDTPVLRCPSDSVTLVAGGKPVGVDVTSVCHVWTADPSQATSLNYTASWSKQPPDVDLKGSGQTVTLTAGGAAKPGTEGTVRIGVQGKPDARGELAVRLAGLGAPSIAPITIDGFKAGTTATRNIAGLVDSPLRNPTPTVVRLVQTSGEHATVSTSGSTISLTPGADTHGTMTFTLVVSDIAATNQPLRQASTTVTLNVLNHPDAPGTPQPGRTVQSRVIVLSWPTPADNGAPIDSYQVSGGGHTQSCPASPCAITGLTNGQPYSFTVRAHNAVGYGPPSPASPSQTPDTLPGAVSHITVSGQADGRVTLSWPAAPDQGSPVTQYSVTWNGGHATTAGSPYTVRGLDNDTVYTFTVKALNKKGYGPATSTTGESVGTPTQVSSVNAAYANAAGTSTRTVTISWQGGDRNGPDPTGYVVQRNGTTVCQVTAPTTSCNDQPSSGSTYNYTVTTTNGAAKSSAPKAAPPFEVAGTPDTPSNVSSKATSTDGQLALTYSLGSANGAGGQVVCTYNGGSSCGSWPDSGNESGYTISSLPKGQSVTVTLVQRNDQQSSSPASAQPTTTAGPPSAPSQAGNQCGLSGSTVTWNWNAASSPTGYGIKYQLGNAGSGTTSSTQYSKNEPQDGQSNTLTVTSVDSRGESGGTISITCQDAAKPVQKDANVAWGGNAQGQPNCSSSDCHYVKVNISGFSPNASYNVTFTTEASGGEYLTGTITVNTGSDGSGSGTSSKYYGYPGVTFDLTVGGNTYKSKWP